VFDSSGPEGRVRGTPQQVFEKYSQLARDAELGNDRVAQKNFQQQAEHYLRMLTVAQRETDARRELHERENRERQVERDRERESANRQAAETRREDQQKRHEGNRKPDAGAVVEARDRPADQVVHVDADLAEAPQPDVFDHAQSSDSSLVETPENTEAAPAPKPKPKRAPSPSQKWQPSQ
jgi:hypothetical protein